MNLPRDILGSVELSSLTSTTAIVQLIGTCRIGRKTIGEGALGPIDNWAQIATGVPCRLFKARTKYETVQGGQVRAVTVFSLQLTLGQDIAPADQVEKDGLLYEVSDTDAGTDYAVYLTAFLTRIRPTEVLW